MQRREFIILLSYAAIARPAVARAAVDDAQSVDPLRTCIARAHCGAPIGIGPERHDLISWRLIGRDA